ncbi:hypothetical protein C943_04571 [Mariniradius saccharolyticus AK6]|uniref:Uncharacterized protein n=1 Tax=Mariniradius saccharolyticus AK6 TaxID=1239962 RepID=M7XYY1_9BACT|nr:hypothetical protein C943_04571 [Mariniradius saccharolyticus AK6]
MPIWLFNKKLIGKYGQIGAIDAWSFPEIKTWIAADQPC